MHMPVNVKNRISIDTNELTALLNFVLDLGSSICNLIGWLINFFYFGSNLEIAKTFKKLRSIRILLTCGIEPPMMFVPGLISSAFFNTWDMSRSLAFSMQDSRTWSKSVRPTRSWNLRIPRDAMCSRTWW